ncbi:MAG: helicase HerA-like domain-containing protein [Rhodospirillales bacterium]
MTTDNTIVVGRAEGPVVLDARYANRHGLIAGATGTGKTVTLQTLAEGFSALGTPVFLVDVKGDLSGLCSAGADTGPFADRARQLGLDGWAPQAFPVAFWDVFGSEGTPVRATVSEMGPLLLSRLLSLNPTQEGVLNAAFAVADDRGLLLLDLKDLRAILQFVADNAKEMQQAYGNIAPTTAGAIQRNLLVLEREGGTAFFGEPALALNDLMTAADGRGMVNVLAADVLINKPRLYASVLLWLLSELFEELPEVGDRDRPKLVLFFDEAHLLFEDAPKTLIDKIEQVVRLIRSKGVGVFFVTQNPTDIPEDVLAQLGNRVQHALRAFTAKDQKAVKAAAATFRANPAFSTEQAITELAVGEALVSMLEQKGTPGMVQRALIAPPRSRVGPAPAAEREAAQKASPMADRYGFAIDRQSAYEQLRARAETAAPAASAPAPSGGGTPRATRSRKPPPSIAETLASSAARSIGSKLGRELVRGVLGSLFRGR